MYSVMQEKPASGAPTKQRFTLDMRALNAAVKDASSVQNAMGSYVRQASARRISAEKQGSGMPAAVSRRLFTPAGASSAGY